MSLCLFSESHIGKEGMSGHNTLAAYYHFLSLPLHCFSTSLRSLDVDFRIEVLAIDPLTGKEECLVNILAACYPATLPARTVSYPEKAATMPSPSFSLAHILIHTGRLLSKQSIRCKTPEPVLWLSPFGNTADVKKFSFWHSPRLATTAKPDQLI